VVGIYADCMTGCVHTFGVSIARNLRGVVQVYKYATPEVRWCVTDFVGVRFDSGSQGYRLRR
jgi:hypothetical protein